MTSGCNFEKEMVWMDGTGMPHLANASHCHRPAATRGLQLCKLALEVVDCAGVHEVRLVLTALQVVSQHRGVVLQNLSVYQLPDLLIAPQAQCRARSPRSPTVANAQERNLRNEADFLICMTAKKHDKENLRGGNRSDWRYF